MLLSNDLVYGGLSRVDSPNEEYLNCKCDGQLSENLQCHLSNAQFARNSYKYGICSSSPYSFTLRYTFGLSEGSEIPCNEFALTKNPKELNRPQLVILRNGIHDEFKTEIIFKSLNVIFDNHMKKIQKCPTIGNIHYIFLSQDKHHPKLDEKYPTQSNDIAALYDLKVAKFLDNIRITKNISVTFVNTSAIGGETSDGYHPLTESYMIRTMYLLSILDQLV